MPPDRLGSALHIPDINNLPAPHEIIAPPTEVLTLKPTKITAEEMRMEAVDMMTLLFGASVTVAGIVIMAIGSKALRGMFSPP